MITYDTDNIWETHATLMVIPVNCIGVAGAGLAKQWACRYPHEASLYRKYRHMRPGCVYTMDNPHNSKPEFLLMTTKNHWRSPSKKEWIDSALQMLRDYLAPRKDITVALPKVGCGLGGLSWEQDVQPLVEQYLSSFNIIVYGK